MEKEFIFCIAKPPVTINKEEFYLDLIDALVTELRNYEKVTVIGSELDDYKTKKKAEYETIAYMTIAQKAKIEGRTVQSIIDEYGYEQLGFSEETYKRIGIK